MDNHTTTYPAAGTTPTFADRLRHSKALIPTIAVLGVTALALAAALVVKNTEARPDDSLAMAPEAALVQQTPLTAQANAAGLGTPMPPVQRAPQNVARLSNPIVAQAPRAPVCGNCGTVESATAVQRAAPTSGIGAVAGGVVGGLLGNQVGGGNGRTAMTVLGAVGGGYAGNAIEKRTKTNTTYQMRVRMNDGSVRTFEQSQAVAAGSQVVVEGNSMRLAPRPVYDQRS
ncbi:MAG: glycine zipper 2TM domain-containing protein [Pseudomonadota bacterium]